MKFIFLIILVLMAIILSLNYFKRVDNFVDRKQKTFCRKSADFLERLEKYKVENLCN